MSGLSAAPVSIRPATSFLPSVPQPLSVNTRPSKISQEQVTSSYPPVGATRWVAVSPAGPVWINTPALRERAGKLAGLSPSQSLAQCRTYLNQAQTVAEVIGTLQLIQFLGEAGMDTAPLYGSMSRFWVYPDPRVTIYLTGALRPMTAKEPAMFGPLLQALARAIHQPQPNPWMNPVEEVGGTLLQQLSQWVAKALRENLPVSGLGGDLRG